MWIPKWYFEVQERKMNDLERRVKRLELITLDDAKRTIASLSDEKAGSAAKDGILTVVLRIQKSI